MALGSPLGSRKHFNPLQGAAHARASTHPFDFTPPYRAPRGERGGMSTTPDAARTCGGGCESARRARFGRHSRGVFASRPAERRGDRLYRGARKPRRRTAADGLDPAGFHGSRSGRRLDERAFRTRSRSAPSRQCSRRRRRPCLANGRGCARLRCGGRRRAGGLGRGETARPCRQPQADIGRASFRRDRPGVADGGGASAIDRRDPMDRARGAFAAGIKSIECMGIASVRGAACPQPSWPHWPLDHGMEM